MSVNVNSWIPELRQVLTGATESVVIQATKATLREFYKDSGMWVETLEPIGVTDGVDLVNLSDAAVLDGHDALVHIVNYVKYGDILLRPQHTLNDSILGNTPSHFYTTQSGVIKLIPTPQTTVADILEIQVSLIPVFTNNMVHDDAFNIWFDTILDGVLGRIYQQPGKTYTNLMSAQYHLRRFRSGISKARDEARRRYTKTETGWAYPNWA